MTTTNEPAVVDDETFRVTRTIRIAAPRERVWAALTQEDLIAQWFPQRASLPDARPGTEGTFTFDGYGDVPVRVDELDEPDVFAYTWGSPGFPLAPDNATQVRFTLVADGDATVLTVVETGFERLADPAGAMRGNREGWTSELDELVAFVEAAAVDAGSPAS
ncbi:vanillate O-demethylase oxidoreductase VanB [Luteimicrobium album]|uniref:Vanillate O-demethylase oxidoreductase VanB n=1 Tax=Luteimicrobium album TaxID=1054550 RepID=A0ABQ6HZ09_9MICO|nr:SRPBCC family protein [Luteimicrobium album]GMA23637.1 vanillate O-demethylase oxidoreductase VanB [Luteimicrobium album]